MSDILFGGPLVCLNKIKIGNIFFHLPVFMHSDVERPISRESFSDKGNNYHFCALAFCKTFLIHF
jgi:hypothetical protein